MGECFELSIISKNRIRFNAWQNDFNIGSHVLSYNGILGFYDKKEILLREDEYSLFWAYEISVAAKSLFMRENIIDEILFLLETVSIIHDKYKIEYAIANFETNALFIDENQDALVPSKDMILKSALIFIPESKLESTEINLYHIIFKLNKIVCLYNPTSGILFSSQNEKHKILKESLK